MIENLKEAQNISFEESELIFVGRVTEIRNDGSYVLENIELFKGELKDSTIVNGILDNYCSNSPRKLYETWLVYTSYDVEGKISISNCGLSRSFQFPYYYGSHLLPPPPPFGLNDPLDILELEYLTIEYKKRALEELKIEIQFLREMKNQIK
ncbi:hypothetical protein [Algoriphagus ratkowskyi]|nr:hypothetical protein [Algoriphagus ratkowskyi]TXD78696.1 hypothetical protein ESW18_07865 [Algoriphagus ratkowskyi]